MKDWKKGATMQRLLDLYRGFNTKYPKTMTNIKMAAAAAVAAQYGPLAGKAVTCILGG